MKLSTKITALLCVVSTISITQTETSESKHLRVTRQTEDYNVAIQSLISRLGPRQAVDVMFLIGRHRSIGKRAFYGTARPLFMSMLKQFASVHKDYARVAVMSFGSEYSVDYDDISTNSGSVYPKNKCDLLPQETAVPQPLDKVVYKDNEDRTSCGLQGALSKADEIFRKSSQPSKVLVLMSDGNFMGCNFNDFGNVVRLPELTNLRNVLIHGITYGQLNNVYSSTIKNMVSTENGVYMYASSAAWSARLSSATINSPRNGIESSKFLDPVSSDFCRSTQDIPNSSCYCDISFGYYRRLCDPGYTETPFKTCQACPRNTYKSSIGKGDCLICYPNYVTASTASKSLSDCKPISASAPIYADPCVNNNCSPNRVCLSEFRGLELVGRNCSLCESGYDPMKSCIASINDCVAPSATCNNNGKCVDGWNDYSCLCENGFYGKTCENNFDSCRFPNICGPNGRCITDLYKEGLFVCSCNSNYHGEFCEYQPNVPAVAVDATTTTSPPTSSTTLSVVENPINPNVQGASGDETPPSNLVVKVVPAVICSFFLLILVIVVLLYKFWYVKKQKNSNWNTSLIAPVHEPTFAASNPLADGPAGSYGSNGYTYSPVDRKNSFYEMSSKTSNTFDRRLFNRASKIYDAETIKEGNMMSGSPRAPSDINLDDDNQVELVLPLSTVRASEDLSDWKTFLNGLISNSTFVNNALLANIHKNRFVATDEWADLNWDEILSVDTVIGDKCTVELKGEEYFLGGEPKNRTVVGRNLDLQNNDNKYEMDKLQNENMFLILGRSNNFLLILSANDEVKGNNLVQSLTRHIMKEGH